MPAAKFFLIIAFVWITKITVTRIYFIVVYPSVPLNKFADTGFVWVWKNLKSQCSLKDFQYLEKSIEEIH